MSEDTRNETRLLSASEREDVELTRHPAILALPRPALQALATRLREARDRATRTAHQQRREMRGKAEPRGAAPARDNTGTRGKEEAITLALRRIGAHLRRPGATDPPQPVSARPKKKAVSPPVSRPAQPKTAGKQPKTTGKMTKSLIKKGGGPKTRIDPRKIGRVSQAGKVAQARRDSKPR